jgi:hypothetical protein
MIFGYVRVSKGEQQNIDMQFPCQMARLYKVSEATISRVIANKHNGSEAV